MNRWRASVHRWWVRYLLVALCCLPLLGALHQVVHGSATAFNPSPSNSSAASADVRGTERSARLHVERGADATAMPAGTWLPQLFAAHGSDADCRVFDQLSHGQPLLSLPALALPAPLALAWLAPPHQAWRSAAPAQAQARGPPLTV